MKVNLCLFKKDGTTKLFSLPSTVTTIGRKKDCDLCIPLPAVSRRHCELNMDQGRLTVRDLNSHNGTFLHGVRIEETPVQPGDELQIADLCFLVQIDGLPANLVEFHPHPVVMESKPPLPADVDDRTEDEDAFEEMLKGLPGMDLDQTLGTHQVHKVDQQTGKA